MLPTPSKLTSTLATTLATLLLTGGSSALQEGRGAAPKNVEQGKPAQGDKQDTPKAADASKKAQAKQQAKKKPGQDPQGKSAQAGNDQQGGKGDADQQGASPAALDPGKIADEKLFEPYTRNDGLLGRLQVVPWIQAMSEDQLANRVVPRLTGERNRLVLEVTNLVQKLGDVRYDIRVRAEKELIDRGPRIDNILKSLPEPKDLEIKIRLQRVIAALENVGREDIERDNRIARGLAESLAYRAGKLEVESLISALGCLDASVRLAALRSLGVLTRKAEHAALCSDKAVDRLRSAVSSRDLELRNAATATIGLMPTDASRKFLTDILQNPERATSHRVLALRLLLERAKYGATAEKATELVSKLEGRDADLLRATGAFLDSRKEATDVEAPKLVLELEDGGKLVQTRLLRVSGDCLLFEGPRATGGVPLHIPRSTIDAISNPSQAGGEPSGRHILLQSGTKLRCQGFSLANGRVKFEALGRAREVAKTDLRGIIPNASKGRILGGSRETDQVRLLAKKNKLVEGEITSFDDKELTVRGKDGERKIAWADVESQVFKLGGARGATGDIGDINQFVQVDLAAGERIVGYLLALDGRTISIADRILGCLEIPLTRVQQLKLSNSGRALTGFTLVADYGNTAVLELDGEGRVVWKLEDLFDPLDAELTATGTVLVTEQADDAVREYDRNHEVVWEFTDLKRPFDADRLITGNTLITDPGNSRVLEVSPDKKIVWSFGLKEARRKDFKPYDADRLANGNTLICDHGGKRVIEVTPGGEVIWEIKNLEFLADADRLPNGNTLVTRRSPAAVLEFNSDGTVVWQLKKLTLPGDADRLPDGTTMVSEDGGVKIYSRDGRVVRTLDSEWATEANGY